MNYKGKINTEFLLKLNECINFLPDDHNNLNWTIVFYDQQNFINDHKDNKVYSKEHYNKILDKNSLASGSTVSEIKEIHLFLFKYEFTPADLIKLIGNIYHEIRHAWQYSNNIYEIENEISPYEDFEAYIKQPWEQDAYKFQLKYMRVHYNKILEIFNLKNYVVPVYNFHEDIMKFINEEIIK
ncbi:hypothetical protein AU385_17940 [Bacillus halotolerans]|uniref:hypothetical protein n=1 Tax=Bacillus halotolerans TaxID=260554 RepID=UPI0007502C04|nr:hypothetical protein [Bacillus halotolerans]KUP30295.1 hypothetical protein AU385_17940 [Bacillus halotolerans]